MSVSSVVQFWRGAVFLWMCALVVVVAWAPVIGSRLDNALFPVVTAFDVQRVEVSKGGVTLSGRLYKPEHRANCQLLEVVAVVNGTTNIKLFSGDDPRVFTRAWGGSEFTGWTIPGDNIRHVRLESRHTCHSRWQNLTMLWDADIPPQVIVDVPRRLTL